MERAPARLGPSMSAWLRGFGKGGVTASFLQILSKWATSRTGCDKSSATKTKAIIQVWMMATKVFVTALARPPSSRCTAPNTYGTNSYDDTRNLSRGNGREGSRVRDGVANHNNAIKLQDQGRKVNQSN